MPEIVPTHYCSYCVWHIPAGLGMRTMAVGDCVSECVCMCASVGHYMCLSFIGVGVEISADYLPKIVNVLTFFLDKNCNLHTV